jgi:hypothetical protein
MVVWTVLCAVIVVELYFMGRLMNTHFGRQQVIQNETSRAQVVLSVRSLASTCSSTVECSDSRPLLLCDKRSQRGLYHRTAWVVSRDSWKRWVIHCPGYGAHRPTTKVASHSVIVGFRDLDAIGMLRGAVLHDAPLATDEMEAFDSR